MYDNKPSIFLLAKPHIDKRENSDGTFEAYGLDKKDSPPTTILDISSNWLIWTWKQAGPKPQFPLKNKLKKVLQKLLHRWSTFYATEHEGSFVDEELLIHVLGYTDLPCT